MRAEREKLEGKVARACGDRDREASGIWEAAGRGYCPHLSKRGDRNKPETRAQGGWQGGGHRVKAQTDAHGCLVCQHDTVVHVVSCVSVLKANRKIRDGLLKNRCTFVFKASRLQGVSLACVFTSLKQPILPCCSLRDGFVFSLHLKARKNFCWLPKKTRYISLDIGSVWHSFECKMQEACPSERPLV